MHDALCMQQHCLDNWLCSAVSCKITINPISSNIENIPPHFQEKLNVVGELWTGSDTESIPESLSDSDSKSSKLEVLIIPEDVPDIIFLQNPSERL